MKEVTDLQKHKKYLFLILLISTLVRGFLAWILEFGNDEVYYRTYALYPDWSHFDHPPMVGFVIQLFSLNLLLDTEFFIRLGSVIFGTLNTWMVYKITSRIGTPGAGLIASMLYTTSIYAFIICGVFILPDTPQQLFWLISLYGLVEALPGKQPTAYTKKMLLLSAFALGAGLLSKYTTLFLYGGVGIYVLLYNRIWLKTLQFWLFAVIPLLFFIPVISWNITNDFISFTFQGERVVATGQGIRFDYFAQEFFGQILYNNPFNWVLIVVSLIRIFRKPLGLFPNGMLPFLLLTSVPLIVSFLAFSLFQQTLPHWTAPAYTHLIILAAVFMANVKVSHYQIPRSIWVSTALLIIVLVLALVQIKFGVLLHDKSTDPQRKGKADFSLDMYGWGQLGEKFATVYHKAQQTGQMQNNAPIVSFRWFPAANLDFYVAKPLGTHLLAVGSLERIHKYAWINEARGGFKLGSDAWFISSSRDYKDPREILSQHYQSIEQADTLAIVRNRDTVMYYYTFRLKNLLIIPENELQKTRTTSQN